MEAEGDTARFVTLLTRSIRFSECRPMVEAPLSIRRFEQIRSLAVADLLEPKMKDKAKALLVRPVLEKTTPQQVGKLRREEHYKPILAHACDQLEQLAGARDMMGAARTFEPWMVEEVLSDVVTATGRDRASAVRELTGRVSAKKGREGGSMGRIFPPEFVELILQARKTLSEFDQKLVGSGATVEPDYSVDAAVPNVPAAPVADGDSAEPD